VSRTNVSTGQERQNAQGREKRVSPVTIPIVSNNNYSISPMPWQRIPSVLPALRV